METFVIRVWTPSDRAEDPERLDLRGLVEHVGSGESEAFREAGELIAFLNARLGAHTHDRELESGPGRKTLLQPVL